MKGSRTFIPAAHRTAAPGPDRSEPFEDRRDPLPAADAHRHQRVTPANPLQLIECLGRDHRAGGTDGMAFEKPVR